MQYKDKPLAELTLRKYEKPFRLNGRSLVRKLCLSLGLLQPADGRDVIVDVFLALLTSQKPLTSSEIEQAAVQIRKKNELPILGLTPSNVRRQLRRLKNLFFVEKIGKTYRITEQEKLQDVFTERIEKFYLPAIVLRIKEYCQAVQNERCKE